MNILNSRIVAVVLLTTAIGCSSGGAKKWPDLHPVHGVVKVGGKTATGGYLSLRSDDESNSDLIVGGKIESDGTYKLSTSHALEQNSTQKAGAPAGRFRVMYMPPGGGDQISGASVDPIDSAKPVTIVAGDNDLTLEIPKPKK